MSFNPSVFISIVIPLNNLKNRSTLSIKLMIMYQWLLNKKSCMCNDCTLDANDNVYEMCFIKFQIVLVKIISIAENIKTIKTKNVRNEWTMTH